MSTLALAEGRTRRRVVGLVSAGHFYSHFVMLCLPPVFPLIRDDLGASYLAVGGVMTAFSATTGVGQIPMGFLVDRFGGLKVLIGGIALIGVCLALVGLSGSYWQLVLLFAVAGIGNSVFHPADYSILNARVAHDHFGRAASVHSFAGYLGWTAAPPAMLALTALFDWRAAVGLVGLAGIATALWLAANGRLLEDRARPVAPAEAAPHAGFRQGLRLMRSPPLAMMFLFFALSGGAGVGLMAFAVVALIALDGIDLVVANASLTAHLFASALGVLAGGWLADRTARHNLVASAAILTMAGCVAALGLAGLPGALAFFLMAAAGFAYGVSSPSRDVIVKAVTPPGSMGVAFGFTATGLSLGSMIAPAAAGWLMDQNRPSLLFAALAAVIAASVVTVVLTRPRRA